VGRTWQGCRLPDARSALSPPLAALLKRVRRHSVHTGPPRAEFRKRVTSSSQRDARCVHALSVAEQAIQARPIARRDNRKLAGTLHRSVHQGDLVSVMSREEQCCWYLQSFATGALQRLRGAVFATSSAAESASSFE
jgi:hypothetical protein